MEFLKKIFKDDEKIVGLCAFNKRNGEYNYGVPFNFAPKLSTEKLIYSTNYEKNFFLL